MTRLKRCGSSPASCMQELKASDTSSLRPHMQDAGEDDKAKALRKLARKIKTIEGLRFDFDGLLRGYSLHSLHSLHSLYELYWYKSTKTDAESAARGGGASEKAASRYAPPADLVLKYLVFG